MLNSSNPWTRHCDLVHRVVVRSYVQEGVQTTILVQISCAYETKQHYSQFATVQWLCPQGIVSIGVKDSTGGLSTRMTYFTFIPSGALIDQTL